MMSLMYDTVVKALLSRRALSMSPRRFPFSLVLILGLSLLAGSGPAATIAINEIAASNGGSVDNGGKNPDWIELYNTTGGAIAMGGMSLTNLDNKDPRFFFPAGTV